MLNPKYEIFCNEYVKGTNGTKSAIIAGYKESRAKVTACDLLGKPEVKNRIKELREALNKKFELSQDFVIENLLWASKVAKGEIKTKFVAKDGTPQEKEITDLSSFIKIQSIFAKHTGLLEVKKVKQKQTSRVFINLGNDQTELDDDDSTTNFVCTVKGENSPLLAQTLKDFPSLGKETENKP